MSWTTRNPSMMTMTNTNTTTNTNTNTTTKKVLFLSCLQVVLVMCIAIVCSNQYLAVVVVLPNPSTRTRDDIVVPLPTTSANDRNNFFPSRHGDDDNNDHNTINNAKNAKNANNTNNNINAQNRKKQKDDDKDEAIPSNMTTTFHTMTTTTTTMKMTTGSHATCRSNHEDDDDNEEEETNRTSFVSRSRRRRRVMMTTKTTTTTTDDTTVTVACRTFVYKAPHDKLRSTRENIVFGILSGHRNGRDAIRATWGKTKPQQTATEAIYFVVASPTWTTDLETEYEQYQDMIWLQKHDLYMELTDKTMAFIQIVETYASPSVRFLMKTDDDVYVNVPLLQERLHTGIEIPSSSSSSKTNQEADSTKFHPIRYMGWCHTNPTRPTRPDDRVPRWKKKFALSYEVYPEPYFPPYCTGQGYVLDRRHPLHHHRDNLNHQYHHHQDDHDQDQNDEKNADGLTSCMARRIPSMRYHPFEDVAVGLLAERCGVRPQHTEALGHFEFRPDRPREKIYQHNIKSVEAMMEYEASLLPP